MTTTTKTFTIDAAGPRDFRVLEVLSNGGREYCQTYGTRREAVRGVVLAFFYSLKGQANNVFDAKGVAKRTGLKEAAARRVLGQLTEEGVLNRYVTHFSTQSTYQSHYGFSSPHKRFEYALKEAK